jgi:hypothetical protein
MANFGLDVALDMTVQFTQNFTGSYFFEELQGGERVKGFRTQFADFPVGIYDDGACARQALLMRAALTTRSC